MQRSPDENAPDGKTAPLTSRNQLTPGSKRDVAQPAQQQAAQPQQAPQQKVKKFHNGWTTQLESLAAEWSDKAACYKWMHEKSEMLLGRWNMIFTIPVILLSTITGTANFGINSLVPGETYGKYANATIGGISLIAGMISTVANFLRYAQASEAHRVAGISWGKFQRFISTELALHPNERMDAMSFLKMGRVELDRLIEQSPVIPRSIIAAFEAEFKSATDLKKPEITGGLEHTKTFDDRESRITHLVSEAGLLLRHKKRFMTELIKTDIEKQIAAYVAKERLVIEREIYETVAQKAREAALRVIRAELGVPPKNTVSLSVVPTPIATETGEPQPEAIVLEVQGDTAALTPDQMADLVRRAT